MSDSQYKKEDLVFGVIDKAGDPNFDKVYECYKRCFTLPEEQESRENFESILSENGAPGKPGKEMWVYAKDKVTGEVVGASNFDTFHTHQSADTPADKKIDGTIQAIYMLVSPEHRRRGLFDIMVEARENAAKDFIKSENKAVSGEPKILTFAEQNEPMKMTPNQYIEDTKAAGIDQIDRRDVFEQQGKKQGEAGFKTLAARYMQPPLEQGGETCDYLDLIVKAPPDTQSIPSKLIADHLNQFFVKSFPEGSSLDMPEIAGMKRDLEAKGDIALLDQGKFTGLKQSINVPMLEAMLEAKPDIGDKLIGEIRPDLVERYYGKGATIDAVMESNTKVEEQRRVAALNQPSLFTQSPETISKNIQEVAGGEGHVQAIQARQSANRPGQGR